MIKKIILIIGFLLWSLCLIGKEKIDKDLSLLQVDESKEDMVILSQMQKRRTYLDLHTYSSWASVGLMIATLATAPDEKTSSAHKWLGVASGVAYMASASFAYLAPKPKGTKISRNIKVHEKLVYIHAPAMLLSMISGITAHNKRKDRKELDSFSKAHKAFAGIATISFGLATISSMDFSLKFIPGSSKEVACQLSKSF